MRAREHVHISGGAEASSNIKYERKPPMQDGRILPGRVVVLLQNITESIPSYFRVRFLAWCSACFAVVRQKYSTVVPSCFTRTRHPQAILLAGCVFRPWSWQRRGAVLARQDGNKKFLPKFLTVRFKQWMNRSVIVLTKQNGSLVLHVTVRSLTLHQTNRRAVLVERQMLHAPGTVSIV